MASKVGGPVGPQVNLGVGEFNVGATPPSGTALRDVSYAK